MKRKFLIFILAIVSTFACALGLTACNNTDGTYYKLNANGELDRKTYFVLKSGKWEDEDGESGTYKKDGEKIIFYYTFFGETEELTSGTLKDNVLKVNNDTYISEKHKHNYGEWETKEATCTAQGYETRSCSCGIKEMKTITALGHNWKCVITEEATCVKEGSQAYTCSRCNEKGETKAIEKIPHSFSWVIIEKATCLKEGSQTYTCSGCNEKGETKIIEKASHSFSEWQYDYDNHYKTCLYGCNEKFEKAEHIGENTCTVCKYHYGDTIGLNYTLNNKKDGYILTGIGSATKLKEIIIPAQYNNLPVLGIGGGAFRNCKSLTSIIIPDSVTSIYSSAFAGCTLLETITVDINNSNYKSENNCLLTKDGKTLVRGTNAGNIPVSVTKIDEYAFSGCSSLTVITIPDSVTIISKYVFKDCATLTSIIFEDTVGWQQYFVSNGNKYNIYNINSQDLSDPLQAAKLIKEKEAYYPGDYYGIWEKYLIKN